MSTTMYETGLVQKVILDLENRYWRAIRDRDFATCLELTDDPCVVAGARGVAQIDHATFRNMMNSASHVLRGYEMRNAQFLQIRDDVAVLAYEIHEELSVDGKNVSLDASEASVWAKRDGNWVCVVHTVSLKGDPFGRDRRLT